MQWLRESPVLAPFALQFAGVPGEVLVRDVMLSSRPAAALTRLGIAGRAEMKMLVRELLLRVDIDRDMDGASHACRARAVTRPAAYDWRPQEPVG